MSQNADTIARTAAQSMSAKYGAGLVLEVEKKLLTANSEKPGQYIGLGETAAIATIAALTVQVAHIAWGSWQARGTKNHNTLIEEIRVKIDAPETLSPGALDEIVQAVVQQLEHNP